MDVKEDEAEGLTLRFSLIPGRDGAVAPVRMHEDDAGLDLSAAPADPTGLILRRGEWRRVGTGVRVAIPAGHVGLVMPRSGFASATGVTVLNAPGVIDPGFTGELEILLVNHGLKAVHIRPGMRVAQLVVVPLSPVVLEEVEVLDVSERGDGGFGSSGD